MGVIDGSLYKKTLTTSWPANKELQRYTSSSTNSSYYYVNIANVNAEEELVFSPVIHIGRQNYPSG